MNTVLATLISWENTVSSYLEKKSGSHSVISDSLRPQGLHSPWNSPGQNTGVDNLSLLQGVFPTQGSNPDLLHCRQILCQLRHKRRPRILEWVAYPFSSRSSWPRSWTGVSFISGGFFTNWAIRAPLLVINFGSQITPVSVRSGTKENVKIKNRSNPLKREQKDYSFIKFTKKYVKQTRPAL